MKKFLTSLIFMFAAPLYATITIDFTSGIARDTAGTEVADGTLWALVVDGGDGNITGIDVSTGGGNNGGSLYSTANPNTFFNANQSLSIGDVIGDASGDKVFAIGKFDSTTVGDNIGGTAVSLKDMTLGTNGLTAGKAYAFYWFPGAIYTGAGSYSLSGPTQNIGTQVGGISNITFDTGNAGAMLVPTDGSSENQGAFSSDIGGRWSVNDFTAVTLVPEPSAALLALAGTLLLIRRRRNG